MVTVKSLATGLIILALFLYPSMYLLFPAQAAVLKSSNEPTESYDSSSSVHGALVEDSQPASSNARSMTERSQVSHEWVMQRATTRNSSLGSAAVSSNATRIVVPVARGQNSVSAAAPSAQLPTIPTWLWALIPIIIVVVLVALLMLRTIFQEDGGHSVSKTAYEGGEAIIDEHYGQRDAHVIPIKGSDESGDDVYEKRDTTGRRTTRIKIDDTESEGRAQDDGQGR